jgi:hypothetical protein
LRQWSFGIQCLESTFPSLPLLQRGIERHRSREHGALSELIIYAESVLQISFKLNDNFGVPLDPNNSSHVDGATHFNSLQLGTFGNPIFLGTDYPDSFKQTIKDYVPLSHQDLAYFNGTADFFGVDPYTATTVAPPSYGIEACTNNQSE